MLKNKFYLSKLSQGAVLLIADSLFFGVTDPKKAPSVLFIFAFVLAGLTFYWVANLIYKAAMAYGVPLKHQKRAVIYTTSCLMGVIALQSLGQLSPRDIAIILPFAAMAYFYISYQQRHLQTLR